MASFDPASAGVATLTTGVLAAGFMRRTRGWLQRFLVSLAGLCLINLVVVVMVALPEFHFVRSLPTTIGVLLFPVLVVCHVATATLHLPSLILLGIDENLERHGVLVTSLGQVADLLVLAAIAATLIRRDIVDSPG